LQPRQLFKGAEIREDPIAARSLNSGPMVGDSQEKFSLRCAQAGGGAHNYRLHWKIVGLLRKGLEGS